jgi:hypothetical protein
MDNKLMGVRSSESKFEISQDVSEYVKFAKESRSEQARRGDASHYRSFAIIPDIVALEILTNHGLNLHEGEFMSNPADVSRIKRIIKSEYPYLLTSSVLKG